ncbi:hypothetical protein GCM10025868_46520 [Angustibacter aerolatus]|uniref:Uncharacterized protein n=2 Tax=Angustibacter aerolatus TaxID=1162965 RepID=A0ABQ6JRE8_9ACTN|nr:hypothetical protein [Angustibacter aerolatus]GMA89402.1 hypothetical protein GCM10025868_46520 [Angustibacter aerolatus]
MKTLANHQLIKVVPQAGAPNLLVLMDESGNGTPYTPPSKAYTQAGLGAGGSIQRERNVYFRLSSQPVGPRGHSALNGPGLVMLLILLAEQGGDGAEVWFSTAAFPARYHISASTRAEGTRRLRALHLLSVERHPLAARSNPTVFDTRRRRSVYRLRGPALAPDKEMLARLAPAPLKKTPRAKKSRTTPRMGT